MEFNGQNINITLPLNTNIGNINCITYFELGFENRFPACTKNNCY